MLNSVMVVDDESSIRSAVEQWLSLSGFRSAAVQSRR